MFCGKCGCEIKDGFKFCPKCGKSLVKTYVSENARQTLRDCSAEPEVNTDTAAAAENTDLAAEKSDFEPKTATPDNTRYAQTNDSAQPVTEEIGFEPETDGGVRNTAEPEAADTYRENPANGEYGVNYGQIEQEYYGGNFGYGTNAVGTVSENSAKPGKKAKSKALTAFLSIVVCVFVFAAFVSTVAVASIRIVFNEKNIKNICSDIDLSEIKVEYNGEYVGIGDLILETVNPTIVNEYGITDEILDNALQNPVIKSNLEDVYSEYICFVLYGDEAQNLSVSGIMEVIHSCADVVYSETGYAFTQSDYDDIQDELVSGSMSFLVADNIKSSCGGYLSVLNALLSLPSLIINIVVLIGLIVLLMWLNKWKPKYLCAYVGMTAAAVGFVYVVLGIAVFIIGNFGGVGVNILSLRMVSGLATPWLLIFGAAALIVGIVMFLIYMKVFVKKKLS